jgi:hypothetical protein
VWNTTLHFVVHADSPGRINQVKKADTVLVLKDHDSAYRVGSWQKTPQRSAPSLRCVPERLPANEARSIGRWRRSLLPMRKMSDTNLNVQSIRVGAHPLHTYDVCLASLRKTRQAPQRPLTSLSAQTGSKPGFARLATLIDHRHEAGECQGHIKFNREGSARLIPSQDHVTALPPGCTYQLRH